MGGGRPLKWYMQMGQKNLLTEDFSSLLDTGASIDIKGVEPEGSTTLEQPQHNQPIDSSKSFEIAVV